DGRKAQHLGSAAGKRGKRRSGGQAPDELPAIKTEFHGSSSCPRKGWDAPFATLTATDSSRRRDESQLAQLSKKGLCVFKTAQIQQEPVLVDPPDHRQWQFAKRPRDSLGRNAADPVKSQPRAWQQIHRPRPAADLAKAF